MRSYPAKLLVPAQIATAIVALLLMAMWPPASGRMLLVPLSNGDANAVARVALASGAVMLGAGPFPGSLVVIGDRSRIARVDSSNLFIMAAPPAGCGAAARKGVA